MCDIKDIGKAALATVSPAAGVATYFGDQIGDFASDPFGSKKAAKKADKQADAAKTAAEEKEAQRLAAIKAGNANIDSAFGQFDGGYYDNYKDAYTGYYNPQISQQHGDAIGKLTAALAGRGQLGATAGNQAFGKVQERYDTELGRIGNEAETSAKQLEGTVQDQKTNLYTLNQAAADPEGINARAIAEATSLVAPPAYSPLGMVFQDVINPYLGYRNSRQNAIPQNNAYTPSYYSNSGSGRVVN